MFTQAPYGMEVKLSLSGMSNFILLHAENKEAGKEGACKHWIMCSLCTLRPICWSTYRPTLGRYVDQDVSADISTDTRPICWSICWPTDLNRYISQVLVDMSIDRLLTFRRYLTATCILVTVAWVADISNVTAGHDSYTAVMKSTVLSNASVALLNFKCGSMQFNLVNNKVMLVVLRIGV